MSMRIKFLPVFLLMSICVGCSDYLELDLYDSESHLPSLVLEAKQNVESGKVQVSLLDMEKAYSVESKTKKSKYISNDFIIDWYDYRIRTDNNEDVVYIPIIHKNQQVFSMLSENGRLQCNNYQMYSALLLRKGLNGKGFDAVIATYLYNRNTNEDDIKRMCRDFENADYNGYYITSSLDGKMFSGRYIEDGETKFLFRQNPLSPKERKKKVAESDSLKQHEHHHLFLNFNSQQSKIRTKSNNDIEWIITHCPYCGELFDNCDCFTIYPKCEYCNTDVIDGYCGHACTLCDVCMIGSPDHNHSYGGNGGSNGDNGSSDSGSGGSNGGSSGSSGSGSSGNGSGNSPTFSERSKTERVAILIASATIAVEKVRAFDKLMGREHLPDSQQPMMCNYSVGKFYEELFGEVPDYLKHSTYDNGNYEFALANEWYDRLPLHPEDWIEIEAIRDDNGNVLNLEQWMQEIQAKADDGYFVVGVADGRLVDGIRRPGHIVVVIPSSDGNLVSGYWSVDTPYTIDCGSGKRNNKTDLSDSFRNQSIWGNKIRFYYHK